MSIEPKEKRRGRRKVSSSAASQASLSLLGGSGRTPPAKRPGIISGQTQLSLHESTGQSVREIDGVSIRSSTTLEDLAGASQSEPSSVPFPAATSPGKAPDDFDNLKAQLRGRLDSDQRQRLVSTSSNRSRRESNASSVHSQASPAPSKLRKKRPSNNAQPEELNGGPITPSPSVHFEQPARSPTLGADNSLMSHSTSFASSLGEQADTSSSTDPPSPPIDQSLVLCPILKQSSSSSSSVQTSPPTELVETATNTEEPQALQSAPTPTQQYPTTLVHWLLSLPLAIPLSVLSNAPVIRLFVPTLAPRPTLAEVLRSERERSHSSWAGWVIHRAALVIGRS